MERINKLIPVAKVLAPVVSALYAIQIGLLELSGTQLLSVAAALFAAASLIELYKELYGVNRR